MTVLRKPISWLLVLAAGLTIAFMMLVLPHYRLYTIHTGSMTPTIPVGSVVLVRTGPVHVGEVITFRPYGSSTPVTHRLTAINADGTLVTQGDANKSPDVDIVTRANVIGPVVAAPRHVGAWLNFALHTRLGYVFDALLLFIMTMLLSGSRPAGGSHRSTPARPRGGPSGARARGGHRAARHIDVGQPARRAAATASSCEVTPSLVSTPRS